MLGLLLLPPEREPGSFFAYNQPCTNALAAIVERVGGGALTGFLRPRLFEPLGIGRYGWWHEPVGRDNLGRRPGRTSMARPWWQWLLGWLALAALLVTLVFYAASGLLAPGWAVALLLVVWLALLAVAIRLLYLRRPLLVLLVPVAAWLIWFGALTAGEKWLGWTG